MFSYFFYLILIYECISLHYIIVINNGRYTLDTSIELFIRIEMYVSSIADITDK